MVMSNSPPAAEEVAEFLRQAQAVGDRIAGLGRQAESLMTEERNLADQCAAAVATHIKVGRLEPGKAYRLRDGSLLVLTTSTWGRERLPLPFVVREAREGETPF